jgi:hypothetical protein
MASIFVVAGIISITFLLAKFLEMRFIEKESKPLKLLIRDALIVYFSVLTANFVIDQINQVVNGISGGQKVTPVFTDNPGF